MTRLPRQLNNLFFLIGVAILYGVYFLFIEPRTEIAERYVGKQSPELEAFMGDIVAKLDKGTHTELYSTIIGQAEDDWSTDPFYEMSLYGKLAPAKTRTDEDRVVRETDFTYSGYLNVGDRKIAIVNDVEFEAGDMLEFEMEKYILKDIYPTKVVIGNKTGSLFLEIPLQEMEE